MRTRTKDERTLSGQYRDILARAGLRREDCSVLAIVFGDERAAAAFHYAAMRATWYEYILIFDAPGPTARQVWQRDNEIRDAVVALAKATAPCTVFNE